MYDSYKDLAFDEALDNKDLRDRIKKLESDLNQEKLKSGDLRMQLVFANQKLRKEHLTTNPVDDGNGNAECGPCCVHLDDEWTYCPSCGKRIDWVALEIREDEQDNWYAEEGERFLQAEVYDPIRERWGD